MKYGPLGRSGLIVSRICLGGNSWGAKGRRGWGKFDEAEAPAYFRRALDVGGDSERPCSVPCGCMHVLSTARPLPHR